MALGVAALFSTCVEAFDIVVSAKECTQEYEELSALLGIQQLRFGLWGQLVGLPSGFDDHQPPIPYNTKLDLPHVRPRIERALDNIRNLLRKVAAVDGRYGVTLATLDEETTTLRGTHIFHKPFDKLKARIRKGQKQKSMVKVMRWALHDATQFKDAIAQLTAFVDGLYQVTTSLDILQKHIEELRIHSEVQRITNEGDLELLAEATSKHSISSIHRSISDAASRRLSVVNSASILGETRTQPRSNASTYSFHTAKTRPSERHLEAVGEVEDHEQEPTPNALQIISAESSSTNVAAIRSCAECDDIGHQCSVDESAASCFNCIKRQKQCSFDLDSSVSSLSDVNDNDSKSSKLSPISSRTTPQHERLIAEATSRSRAIPISLSFEDGDAHHGDHMSAINDADLDYWIENGPKLILQANRSTSADKRMLLELRNIRKAKVPFISATPIGDNLGEILASIEGPPNTPYEGGIFWILVLASKKMPPKAPILRFLTKIYHPNIDHRTGVLCADYQQKWNPSKAPSSMRVHLTESTTLWSARTSPDQWTLLALLIAICALLASPNADDPLIPEIAQKYVEDPQGYHEAAKMWTKRYASPLEKPDVASLLLAEESLETDNERTTSEATQLPEVEQDNRDEDPVSPTDMYQYFRWRFEGRYISNGVLCVKSRYTALNAPKDPEDGVTAYVESRDSMDPNEPEPFPQNVDLKLSSKRAASKPKFSQFSNRSDKSQFPNLGNIVKSFLIREVNQGYQRQIIAGSTGDFFSNFEEWRLFREIRLDLEKNLFRYNPTMRPDFIFTPRALGESEIRNLIKTSANRSPLPKEKEGEEKYFETLKASFIEAKRDVSTRRRKLGVWNRSRLVKVRTIYRQGRAHRSRRTWNPYYPPGTTPSPIASPIASPASSRSPSLTPSSTPSRMNEQSRAETGYPLQVRAPSRHHSQHPLTEGIYTPSPRYHSRHPFTGDTCTHSPRYHAWHTRAGELYVNNYTQYYAISTQYEGLSPTRRASREGSNQNDEYVEYSVDGVVYRVQAARQQSRYSHRGHGTDYYYYQNQDYAYDRSSSPQYEPPKTRRQSSLKPQQPGSRPISATKKSTVAIKATEEDARKHRIPPGCSLKNWDPREEPIRLLGSIFDSNSLGKWIYDWTQYHHGPATPMADMAGELWLLLIQLAGKIKRAEECMPRIRHHQNREMLDDFIASGERLTDRFRKLLKSCETPMLKAGKKKGPDGQLGKDAGIEFVETIFGRDRNLEATEKFMNSIRLWNLRFDANCEDILRHPGQTASVIDHPKSKTGSTKDEVVMTPVPIRTTFGLKAIREEKWKEPQIQCKTSNLATVCRIQRPAWQHPPILRMGAIKINRPAWKRDVGSQAMPWALRYPWLFDEAADRSFPSKFFQVTPGRRNTIKVSFMDVPISKRVFGA